MLRVRHSYFSRLQQGLVMYVARLGFDCIYGGYESVISIFGGLCSPEVVGNRFNNYHHPMPSITSGGQTGAVAEPNCQSNHQRILRVIIGIENYASLHLTSQEYSLAGDFGFDPLELGKDPENLRWYVQAELIHARFAMAGVAGILLTDNQIVLSILLGNAMTKLDVSGIRNARLAELASHHSSYFLSIFAVGSRQHMLSCTVGTNTLSL
eukprot:Gb_25595 [translate_table: standard]